YYRLVRLQNQQNELPTIMEIRVQHSVFFSDLLEGNGGDFFSVVMEGSKPSQFVYNPQHIFVQNAGERLEEILGGIHQQLDILQQNSPIKVRLGDQTYYALYRYIAPLDAYVVDVASHQALMK